MPWSTDQCTVNFVSRLDDCFDFLTRVPLPKGNKFSFNNLLKITKENFCMNGMIRIK